MLVMILFLGCPQPESSPPAQAPPVSTACDASADQVLRVHYRDPEAEDSESRVHLWTWGVRESDVGACGRDGFGAVVELPSEGLEDGAELGFRPKLGEGTRGPWLSGDRTWVAGRDCWEVWVSAESDVLFCSEEEALRLRVLGAFWDSPTRVELVLSRPAPNLADPDHVQLEGAEVLEVHAEEHRLVLETSPLDIHGSYTAILQEDQTHRLPLFPRGVMDAYATELRLGSWVEEGQTHFRIWSPRATGAVLQLRSHPTEGETRYHLMEREEATGTWSLVLDEDLHGSWYRLAVDGPRGPLDHFDPDVPINDPWSVVALSSHAGEAGWSMVFDLSRLKPPAPMERRPTMAELVAWEVHVRDLTGHLSSGMPPEEPGYRGYLGVARAGLRGPGGVSTGLDHMDALGVNAVQLLPIMQYPGAPGAFDWGYYSASFFSPHGGYASEPLGEARVHEVRAMVAALHERGVAVVLDAVHNHTAEGSQVGPTINLRGLDGTYWYRQDPVTGVHHNGSGVGNELATERPMARRLVLDSIRHWVQVYGVDGFRFDLAGLVDTQTLAAIAREHPDLLLYGEPWAASGALWAKGDIDDLDPWAVFDDDFRDALKGSPEGGDGGFVQGGGSLDRVRLALSGSTVGDGTARGWATAPVDGVRYLSCHDNLTLADKLEVSLPNVHPREKEGRARLALAALLTSPGPVMLHAGSEMLRTKPYLDGGHGRAVWGGSRAFDANSYSSSDATNNLDWEHKLHHAETVALVQGLIALRLSEAGSPLRPPGEVGVEYFEWFAAQDHGHALGWGLNADLSHGEQRLRVFLNASDDQEAVFDVHFEAGWRLLARTEEVAPPGEQLGGRPEGALTVEPLGLRVYARP